MPYKIAVASGKGGTGKTTVAVNLQHFIHKHLTRETTLVDCDVEEPNDHLFFPNLSTRYSHAVTQLIPEIDTDKCTFCRRCVDYCEYNAIVVLPPAGLAEINPSLCHSCGACLVACRDGAITEKPHTIGTLRVCETNSGKLLEGNLRVGSTMQTLMIKETKKAIPSTDEIVIMDAPPGTSCPVVETVADAHYIILVTEPTPFGLNDLKLMTELLREMQKPFGVVINKAGLGNDEVNKYLEEQDIELLAEMPFDAGYAARYASGTLLSHIDANIQARYLALIDKLQIKMNPND